MNSNGRIEFNEIKRPYEIIGCRLREQTGRDYRYIAQAEAEKKTIYLLELYALQFEIGRINDQTFRRNVANAQAEWDIYSSAYHWKKSDIVIERFSKMKTLLTQTPENKTQGEKQ